MNLTNEQFNILIAIKDYISIHGISPTIRELCEITGKESPATIHFHLKALKKKGYIDFLNKKSRTIRLLK